MNGTKEKKSKLQIIIAVLVLTVILFAEMYLMINFKEGYIAIILLAVLALVSVYVLINAFMTLSAEKEAKREEHFENLYKSEKASYIMLKKSFDEIEEKLNVLQEVSKVPAEEIINAQKGIAKVIINRSKENADAIINSNDQVLERLDEVEETQNTKFTSLSKEQRLELSDFGNQTDMKLQDLLVQLKDTELRLNQAIMNGTKVVVPAAQPFVAPAENPLEDLMSSTDELLATADDVLAGEENFDLDALFPEEVVEENPIFEEEPILETEVIEEVAPVEEPVIEEPIIEAAPMEEEKPPMPDLSDPNKALNADEIAALFANMAPADEPVVEEEISEPEPVEEEPVEEEKPPMPDLSDPNKALNADEIAALFANMAPADEPVAEEVIAEPEPVVEAAPVEEEKPPMPDLSDPNKVMSPDEIAALIANL